MNSGKSVRSGLWVLGVGAIVLSAIWFLWTASAGPGPNSNDEPTPAHDFELEDINPRSATFGETLALRDLYAGRGVVLGFIASWCKPCRDKLPEIERLYRDGRAPIVLVAADEYGVKDSVLIVAERSELTAPILFAPEDRAAELERYYDHEILPATYLIDRHGLIRGVHEGALSGRRLARAIERELDR